MIKEVKRDCASVEGPAGEFIVLTSVFARLCFSFRNVLTRPGLCEQEVGGCISARVVGWTVGKGPIGKSEAQVMAHGIDAE